MLRIAIAGASGRMGRALIQAVHQDNAMQLSVAQVRPENTLVGTDAGEMAGIGSIGVQLVAQLPNQADHFDLLIDFTAPQSTLSNLAICAELGVPVVVGTTGFNVSETAQLNAFAENIPLCVAANFSTGVNLCLQLLQQAAEVLGQDSDIEVVEAHHRNKVDAPSGTALAMGNAIAETMQLDPEKDFVLSREGITGAREANTIGFSTIRGGDIVGDHTVIFAAEGERIEITHKASSRMAFARGAVRASHWLAQQQAGLYDMRDVLGLR